MKSLNIVKDVAKNLELIAGTGDQCLPYDDTRCGDGGKAVEATLTNPRGKQMLLKTNIMCSDSSYLRLIFHVFFS